MSVYTARVVSVDSHAKGDSNWHIVNVSTRNANVDEQEKIPVAVEVAGDISLPTEGSLVLIADVNESMPVVIKTVYDPRVDDDLIPEYEAGERVIAHGASESHIRFESDGTVAVRDSPQATTKPVLTGASLSYDVAGRMPEVTSRTGADDTTLETS